MTSCENQLELEPQQVISTSLISVYNTSTWTDATVPTCFMLWRGLLMPQESTNNLPHGFFSENGILWENVDPNTDTIGYVIFFKELVYINNYSITSYENIKWDVEHRNPGTDTIYKTCEINYNNSTGRRTLNFYNDNEDDIKLTLYYDINKRSINKNLMRHPDNPRSSAEVTLTNSLIRDILLNRVGTDDASKKPKT